MQTIRFIVAQRGGYSHKSFRAAADNSVRLRPRASHGARSLQAVIHHEDREWQDGGDGAHDKKILILKG